MNNLVKEQKVTPEKLELELYRSFSQTTDLDGCIDNFVSTISKCLNVDDVKIINKSKFGQWELDQNITAGRNNTVIEITDSIISALKKDDIAIVQKSSRLSEKIADIEYNYQLFVSLSSENILILSSHKQFSVGDNIEWLVYPCKSFYKHYSFLKRELRSTDDQNIRVSKSLKNQGLSQAVASQDVSPIGQFVLDVDYNIVTFNKAAARFTKLKYHREISDCKTLADLSGTDTFVFIKKNYLDKVANGEFIEFEEPVGTGTEVIYTKKSCNPIYDVNKAFIGYMVFIFDISKLKTTEAQVARSNQIFKNILDQSISSHIAYDHNLEIMFFNAQAQSTHQEFMDITLEIGMHISKIASSPSSFWYNRKIELPSADFRSDEVINYTIDDRDVYMRMALLPIVDDDNEVVGFTESATDITESVLTNKKIGQQLSTLKAVLNSTFNSIYAIDADMKLIAINNNAQDDFERFCGKRPVVGDDLNVIIEPEILMRWNKVYFEKIFNGEKLSYVGKDSSGKIVESMYTPVVDDEGTIIGCLEVCSDISELTQSKQELEVSEAQLRILVENVPTGIVRCNGDGSILDISKSVIGTLGYSPSELKGKFLIDLIMDEDKELIKYYIDNLKVGKNTISTARLIHKDGSIVYAEGLGSVVKKETEQDLEYLFTFNDVSEKVEIERNLEVAMGNYELLFKNMHDSVLVYNFDTWSLLDYNDAFLRFYGVDNVSNISKKDMVPKFSKFLPNVDIWEEFESLLSQIKKRETVRITSVLYDSHKNEKLVEISIFPSLEEEAIAYIVVKDITKSYLNSMENKQKAAIYEKLISDSAEGIDIIEYNMNPKDVLNSDVTAFMKNTNKHKIIVRNELIAKYIGDIKTTITSVEEMLNILTPIQPNGISSFEMAKVIIEDLIHRKGGTLEIRTKNGANVYDIFLTQNVIFVNDKVYIIRHLLDITEKKKSERIIEKQILDLNVNNNELQKYIDSNLQLENFAYIASHDLKAPIRSVISFMQLLKKNIASKVDEKDMRFVDIVLTASTNMQVLIDDLLDYSRINTQAVVFEEVDVNKLLKELFRDINTTIKESKSILDVTTMPTLMADTSRLRQVFQNLITNGIKFVNKGEIPNIKISYEELESDHKFVVSDNGIGIEDEYLDKIFLMFKKLHSENRYTGTGIGLSICKKVIEQHSGKIWVESVLNEGSTFHFTISKNLGLN